MVFNGLPPINRVQSDCLHYDSHVCIFSQLAQLVYLGTQDITPPEMAVPTRDNEATVAALVKMGHLAVMDNMLGNLVKTVVTVVMVVMVEMVEMVEMATMPPPSRERAEMVGMAHLADTVHMVGMAEMVPVDLHGGEGSDGQRCGWT